MKNIFAYKKVFILLVVIFIFLFSTDFVKGCTKITPNWPTKCGILLKPVPIYKELEFLADHWNYLLGFDRPTTFIILLQNDTEMRANGGFFGSYAVATMDRAVPSIHFQDIYVPDGQLGDGHVEAPKPIDEAFGKGEFLLRDSDWDPDFVNSAKTIRWFFEKGGEINPDLMVTISLSTIKKIMHIVGPITVPDYDMELSEDNLYNLMQAKVETDFFPGSTQKKDILSGIGHAMVQKLEYLPALKKLEIAKILWQEAKHKNILVNSLNLDLQGKLEANKFAGAINYPKCKTSDESCLVDVFMAIESNLGANKANAYTKTKTIHKISDRGGTLNHEIEIQYRNNSIYENPVLPNFFGGNYINYVRFYIPKAARNIKIEGQPTLPTEASFPEPYTTDDSRLDVSDYYLFKILGLFHTTKAGTNSSIKLSYELPKSVDNYELNILKQNGMQSSPQEIIFNGETANTNLEDDFVFSSVK